MLMSCLNPGGNVDGLPHKSFLEFVLMFVYVLRENL